jgi:hypothetical protein
VALIAAGIVVQVAGQGAPAQDGPRFEVASVKPSSATFGGFYKPMPNRFTATGSVVELMTLAYQLANFRVGGGAEWTKRERFDVNATIAGPRTEGDWRAMLDQVGFCRGPPVSRSAFMWTCAASCGSTTVRGTLYAS